MPVAVARPDESPVTHAALVPLHPEVRAHMVLHVTELLGGYSAEGADQCLLDATIFGTHIKLLDIAGFKSLFKFRRRHLSLASRPIRHSLSHLCRCNQLLDAENLLACHSSEIVRPTAMYSKVGGRVSRPCI